VLSEKENADASSDRKEKKPPSLSVLRSKGKKGRGKTLNEGGEILSVREGGASHRLPTPDDDGGTERGEAGKKIFKEKKTRKKGPHSLSGVGTHITPKRRLF